MAVSTAVDQSAVARVLGIATAFKNLRGGVTLLPQRLGIVGQGNTAAVYATTKRVVTSAAEVGSIYGYGSPLHLAARQLLPANGDGIGTIPMTVFPLEDDGSGVASAGDITPSGTATAQASYRVKINNILSEPFLIPSGVMVVADIVTLMTNAINAVLEMPVIATDSTTVVDLASKWQGESANDIKVEIVGDTTLGNTFAITQPTGGLNNPDVQDALDLFGDIWYTMVLNCLDSADTTAFDAYSVFGEGRWGALVRKPLVVFTGSVDTTVAAAITIPDARKTDRINVQLPEPGGVDLPLVVAARQLARIIKVANNKPANDYGSQSADGLTPGADGVQWDQTERETAVKGGSSTIEVRDGVVTVSDVVTFYHPAGEEPPAYRFVKDIVKLQNVIFNLDLIYKTPEWDGAPLIPDNQPTSNRDAKKPSMATAATAAMLDSLGLEAIISDPTAAKASIVSAISSSNPNRLDQAFTIQVSGNSNIISIDLNFGFFFGEATVVA